MTQASIKVGMIAEETGALSFMGRANANVARMVVDEINTNGGLLGPAEMVPGQHHVRMNMYIAQAKSGRFEIVESLGAIDPDEAMVPSVAEFGRRPIA
jgi:hypothetical protein